MSAPTPFPDCGTERAYWRHAKRRETADQPCLQAHATAERERRDTERGAPPRVPAPCGTEAAYRRHRYRRQDADPACLAAHTRANQLREQASHLAAAIFGAPDTKADQ